MPERTVRAVPRFLKSKRGFRFFAKPNVIELLDVGPHEIFYRDLQQYLDAR